MWDAMCRWRGAAKSQEPKRIRVKSRNQPERNQMGPAKAAERERERRHCSAKSLVCSVTDGGRLETAHGARGP